MNKDLDLFKVIVYFSLLINHYFGMIWPFFSWCLKQIQTEATCIRRPGEDPLRQARAHSPLGGGGPHGSAGEKIEVTTVVAI